LYRIFGNLVNALIRDLDTNLSTFLSFSAANKDFVLNGGPWAFNGCILLLKQMTILKAPSGVEFLIACFCVEAYDIPNKKQTASFARIIASNIDQLVSRDKASMLG